ncbi:carbohydrate ABC transporter permease [Mesoplasma seiffertii]|uniref:carbohydrate ABC transporter permease n=1 Tax=Mesoplasma seiffertii TaxID=28224 RepID=UPI00047C9DD3|nr:sugar ABC transporter permease [Mesoplasma seiffertii]
MQDLENLKRLSTREKVYNELSKLNFKEFTDLFKEIDETYDDDNFKDTSYTFSNKQIAKIFEKFGITEFKNDLRDKFNKKFIKFLQKDTNGKVIFNKFEIENYFSPKDDQFVKEMFDLKARKQLAKISYEAKIKELKDFKTKMNKHYTKFEIYSAKFIYRLENQWINISFDIAKRKVKEMKMLITNNGDTFYMKSKGQNIKDFNNKKNDLKKEINHDLKKISRKLPVTDKLKMQSTILDRGKEISYDYEVKSLKALVKQKFLLKKIAIKSEYESLIKQAKKTVESLRSKKTYYNEKTKEKIIHFKDEFKNEITLAVTQSEIKNIKQQYKQEIKSIKNSNEYTKTKTQLKYLKHLFKNELKKNYISYNSEIENINNSFPVEVSNYKKWMVPFLAIIPGVGQMLNKQYKKGFLMFLTIPIIALFVSYGFGIGNVGGNGILGLIDFGASNPNVNDGRFFMIEGIIGLILIVISSLIITLSIVDAKNVSKQMHIGARPNTWRQTRAFLKSQGTPYILSLPAMIGIIFVILVPIIATLLIAFTNYGKGFDPARPGQYISWVGVDNFKAIFGGKYTTSFKYVMLWTFIWVIFATGGSVAAGTIAALLVNNDRLKGKSFFRLFLILPWAVPAFIMIMMFSLLFANESFNEFTKKIFGVDGWTRQETQVRVALIFIQAWLGQSYLFLLITGVIQGIPKDLYDSAMIDGANKRRQLIKITIPIVITQIAPLLVGQFTFNFGNFGIFSLYGANGVALNSEGFPYPGNPGITDILISFVYKLSTQQQSYTYGLASAFVIVSSAFVVGVSAIGFKNMKAFKN